jgi:hypothetical protein
LLFDASSSAVSFGLNDLLDKCLLTSFKDSSSNICFSTISSEFSVLTNTNSIANFPEIENILIPPDFFLEKLPASISPLLRKSNLPNRPAILSVFENIPDSLGQFGHVFVFLAYKPSYGIILPELSRDEFSIFGVPFSDGLNMIINKYKYLISELSKFIQLCWCIIERK